MEQSLRLETYLITQQRTRYGLQQMTDMVISTIKVHGKIWESSYKVLKGTKETQVKILP